MHRRSIPAMKPWGTLAGVILLTLAACSSHHESPDDRFIRELDESHALPNHFSDSYRDDVIELGRNWCDFLETPGVTRDDVTAQTSRVVARNDGTTALSVITVLGTAARVYCPDAAKRLRQN